MLFILGIPWIFESIHFFLHRDYDQCHPDSVTELVFGFFSSLNYCRGIFFFICFVCKNSVMKKIAKVRLVRRISQLCRVGMIDPAKDLQKRSERKGTFRTDLPS